MKGKISSGYLALVVDMSLSMPKRWEREEKQCNGIAEDKRQ
jgi:DNA-binding transcriptional regulator YiaG